MGKTAGSRKAKIIKNIKKLERVLEVEDVESDKELVRQELERGIEVEDLESDKNLVRQVDELDGEMEKVEKASRKKLRRGIIQDEVDNEIGVETSQVDVDIGAANVAVNSNDVDMLATSLSPKSTLLAFRREVPGEDLQMKLSVPIIASSNQLTAPIYSNSQSNLAENISVPTINEVQVATLLAPAALPRPVTRDTIEYYKQSVSSLAKENESLKALLSQVQDCLKQSQLGFKEYKDVHEVKVSGTYIPE